MTRKFSTAVLDTLLKTVEVEFKVPLLGFGEIKFPVSEHAKEWWENEKAREELLGAIESAEQKFIAQHPDNKAAQILKDFSLKNEKEFQNVIAELLNHLDEQKIAWAMADKLGKGFESIVSNKELQNALFEYIPILQDELGKLREFREVISYLLQKQIAKTTSLTYQTTKEIKDLLLEQEVQGTSSSKLRFEKTVFISYRHTNYWTALAVFQNLNAHGYDVFLDYKSIPSGDFEQVITENIKSRAHFIVILSPSALERCNEPRDWLRKEIETAIEAKRNLIPLMIEGFDFGNFLNLKALTGKLVDLKKYNGMSIPAEYFDEAMAKLRSDRFLNRPLESVRHPISELTKKITKEIQEATSEEREVNHEQLINQEGLEQEYIKSYPLYNPNSPTSQVDRLLQDLAKKWELLKPRIMFSVDCQLPSDIQIKIHEQWLTTSLNNVIRNAISAVKANPAVQPIIIMRGMINGDKVRLEVEDNGSGIPEQISPRIFRDVISNIQHSETGRGLLLTRFILETNGGNIFIKKSDKKGTIIAIDVPIFHATQT